MNGIRTQIGGHGKETGRKRRTKVKSFAAAGETVADIKYYVISIDFLSRPPTLGRAMKSGARKIPLALKPATPKKMQHVRAVYFKLLTSLRSMERDISWNALRGTPCRNGLSDELSVSMQSNFTIILRVQRRRRSSNLYIGIYT